MIDAPPTAAIRAALHFLVQISAFDAYHQLTPLGQHLARMPLDVRLGKMLIYSAMFGCLTPIATIAAILSSPPLFFSPIDKRDEANAARQSFGRHKSDHLTLLNAFQHWQKLKQEASYREENNFLTENFLAKNALQTAEGLVPNFYEALNESGFLEGATRANKQRGISEWEIPEVYNQHADNFKILRAVLCAGLYPNIVRAVPPDKRYTLVASGAIPKVADPKHIQFFTQDDGRVFLHPSSINFSTNSYESPWIAYLTKVKTNKVYIRDCSMVSAYALLLFGGHIQVDRQQGFITVSEWIKFHADLRVAVLVKELKTELDRLLSNKIVSPSLDISTSPVIQALIRLLTSDASS
eukprot:TRINITY_DN12576_c0_g1_i2.p1 TRINITY_DN12576_c0_g1~~TRINITY_DN12576_c0_g1_i2.p1  ORF type:complete len:353 (+),score=89.35 TRINITY_DN12576_c0_g1_i2:57-1115(+)